MGFFWVVWVSLWVLLSDTLPLVVIRTDLLDFGGLCLFCCGLLRLILVWTVVGGFAYCLFLDWFQCLRVWCSLVGLLV